MAEVRIEHTYDCSEDTFWNEVVFDPEYNRRLFLGELGFPKHELKKSEETDTEVRRTVEVTPKLGDLPGPLKKLLGEGLSYREEGVYYKGQRRYVIRIIPNKMADKTKIEGVMSTSPVGEGQCKRLFVCTIQCSVFGVGGLVEKRVAADLEASYGAAARFTNQFLAEKRG